MSRKINTPDAEHREINLSHESRLDFILINLQALVNRSKISSRKYPISILPTEIRHQNYYKKVFTTPDLKFKSFRRTYFLNAFTFSAKSRSAAETRTVTSAVFIPLKSSIPSSILLTAHILNRFSAIALMTRSGKKRLFLLP